MHNETEFVVFGDEKQNIYNRELDENNTIKIRKIPGPWNGTLNTAYRFSSNIGNIAIKFQNSVFGKKYNPDELEIMSQFDFEKEQRIIEYHYFHSFDANILYKYIYKVLESNQISSSDVGILCSIVEVIREIDFLIRTKKNELTTTTFETKEEFEEYKSNQKIIEELRRIKKYHFWMKTGKIKLSTVHSFKGWEIDTLFLFIENEEKEFLFPEEKDNDCEYFTNTELIYTGLTRARRNLIIFNLGNKEYDDFFKKEIDKNFEHL